MRQSNEEAWVKLRLEPLTGVIVWGVDLNPRMLDVRLDRIWEFENSLGTASGLHITSAYQYVSFLAEIKEQLVEFMDLISVSTAWLTPHQFSVQQGLMPNGNRFRR